MSITKEYALFRGNVVKFVSSSIALPTCTCTVYIEMVGPDKPVILGQRLF